MIVFSNSEVFSAETKVISAFKSNLIYVCTSFGVAVQKAGATNLSAPESWDTYNYSTQIPVKSASKFATFNNSILLATSGGIYKLQNNAWSLFTLKDSSIVDLASQSANMYAITKSQLYLYSNNQVAKIYENKNCIFSSIYSNGQAIYISSNKGLIEYKNGKARFIAPNSPASNSFVNLSVGPDGSLWVATGKDLTGKGFFQFDGKKWTIYNRANYYTKDTLFNWDSYYSIYAASDTSVYVGNWGHGVTVLKNGTLQFFNTTNSGMVGIPSDNKYVAITDIKQDSKKHTWFVNYFSAVDKPLSVYTKDKKWYHFGLPSLGISTSEAFDRLVIDQNDTKWFVSLFGNRGVYYFNENGTMENTSDDTQGRITGLDGLTSDQVSCLAIDRRNQLWIGTNVGLNMISDLTKTEEYYYFSWICRKKPGSQLYSG